VEDAVLVDRPALEAFGEDAAEPSVAPVERSRVAGVAPLHRRREARAGPDANGVVVRGHDARSLDPELEPGGSLHEHPEPGGSILRCGEGRNAANPADPDVEAPVGKRAAQHVSHEGDATAAE